MPLWDQPPVIYVPGGGWVAPRWIETLNHNELKKGRAEVGLVIQRLIWLDSIQSHSVQRPNVIHFLSKNISRNTKGNLGPGCQSLGVWAARREQGASQYLHHPQVKCRSASWHTAELPGPRTQPLPSRLGSQPLASTPCPQNWRQEGGWAAWGLPGRRGLPANLLTRAPPGAAPSTAREAPPGLFALLSALSCSDLGIFRP